MCNYLVKYQMFMCLTHKYLFKSFGSQYVGMTLPHTNAHIRMLET